MSNSYCSSEPFSCAAIEQDSTLGLDIQIFYGSYDAAFDVVFRATSLSTYDFSTLYTTLPHNVIKETLINLIEWTFKREGSPYIACNERQAFFTSEDTKRYKLWSCQNVCEALIYLLDNIYIIFGTMLYRQIVGIPMGTN